MLLFYFDNASMHKLLDGEALSSPFELYKLSPLSCRSRSQSLTPTPQSSNTNRGATTIQGLTSRSVFRSLGSSSNLVLAPKPSSLTGKTYPALPPVGEERPGLVGEENETRFTVRGRVGRIVASSSITSSAAVGTEVVVEGLRISGPKSASGAGESCLYAFAELVAVFWLVDLAIDALGRS